MSAPSSLTRGLTALLPLAVLAFPCATAESEAGFHEGADVAWITRSGDRVDLEAHLVPGKVTVFDFWAEWCLPCREVDRAMAAILAEAPDVALRKIDVVEWDRPVVEQHLSRVEALPYLMVYSAEGRRVGVVEGLDLERLERAIDRARGARGKGR